MSPIIGANTGGGATVFVPTATFATPSRSNTVVVAQGSSSAALKVSINDTTSSLVPTSKRNNSLNRASNASSAQQKNDANYYASNGKSKAQAASVKNTKDSFGTTPASSRRASEGAKSGFKDDVRVGTTAKKKIPDEDTSSASGRGIYVDIVGAQMINSYTLRVNLRLNPSDTRVKTTPLRVLVRSRTPGINAGQKDSAPIKISFRTEFTTTSQDEYNELKKENINTPVYFEVQQDVPITPSDLEKLDECYEVELYVASASGGSFNKITPRQTKNVTICPVVGIGGIRLYTAGFHPEAREGESSSQLLGPLHEFWAVASLQGTKWKTWQYQVDTRWSVGSNEEEYIPRYMGGHVFNTFVGPYMPFGAENAFRSGIAAGEPGIVAASSDPNFDIYWVSPNAPTQKPEDTDEPSVIASVDTPFESCGFPIQDYHILPLGGDAAIFVAIWDVISYWRLTVVPYGITITPGYEEYFAQPGYVLPGTEEIPPLLGYEESSIVEGAPFVEDYAENVFNTYQQSPIVLDSDSHSGNGIKCFVISGSEIFEIAPPSNLYSRIRDLRYSFGAFPGTIKYTAGRFGSILGSAMWNNGKYAPYKTETFDPGNPAVGVPPKYEENPKKPLIGPFRELELARETFIGGDAVPAGYGIFHAADAYEYARRILGYKKDITYEVYDNPAQAGYYKPSPKRDNHNGAIQAFPFTSSFYNISGSSNAYFVVTGLGEGLWLLNNLPSGGNYESLEDYYKLYRSFYDAPLYTINYDRLQVVDEDDPFLINKGTKLIFKTSENIEIELETNVGNINVSGLAASDLGSFIKPSAESGLGVPIIYSDWGKPSKCRQVANTLGFDTEKYPFMLFWNADERPDNSYDVLVRAQPVNQQEEEDLPYSNLASISMGSSSYNLQLFTWDANPEELSMIKKYILKKLLKDIVPESQEITAKTISGPKPSKGLQQQIKIKYTSGKYIFANFNMIYGYAIMSNYSVAHDLIDALKQDQEGEWFSPGLVVSLRW